MNTLSCSAEHVILPALQCTVLLPSKSKEAVSGLES